MLKQSLFDDEPINISDLKLKCKTIPIKYEDIVFSPLSQLMCQNCGMFGRTFRCPPFSMKYNLTREYLKQFNKFLLIISESDKEEILKRYNHEREHFKLGEWKSQFYAGTQAAAINLKKSKDDFKILLRFIKARYDKYIGYSSAGCLKCKPCHKWLHQPCAHPYDSFSSPESVGIDLYQTLRNKDVIVESPPIWRYIAVCMIAWKE